MTFIIKLDCMHNHQRGTFSTLIIENRAMSWCSVFYIPLAWGYRIPGQRTKGAWSQHSKSHHPQLKVTVPGSKNELSLGKWVWLSCLIIEWLTLEALWGPQEILCNYDLSPYCSWAYSNHCSRKMLEATWPIIPQLCLHGQKTCMDHVSSESDCTLCLSVISSTLNFINARVLVYGLEMQCPSPWVLLIARMHSF